MANLPLFSLLLSGTIPLTMNTKMLGGILLIVGTAIGAGMLALPVAAAAVGFWNATILLFISWFVMTASSFLVLEVNLWLPRDSNIVAMARSTLGRTGEIIAWLFYLLLFYSLVSAYIAGGSDFMQGIAESMHLQLPSWSMTLLFTAVLSAIVYQGIRAVDYVNRGLMLTKLGIFLVVAVLVLLFISWPNLNSRGSFYTTTTFTVMLTSFGFSNLIPSLRSYFNDDVAKLRKVILIGSLIPLGCYILWDMAIMGVIARDGQQGLLAILNSGHSTSDMLEALGQRIHIPVIMVLTHVFTSICLLTSFLGVSLALFDFLSDGIGIPKQGAGKRLLYLATFLPPFLIVLLDPNIFIRALSYAGIYCMVLLVLLPTVMTWVGRYRQQRNSAYRVAGGKTLLIILMLIGVLVIGDGIALLLQLPHF